MSLYTPAGFFLVRSPALPVDPYVEALDGRGRGARDHLWTLGEQPLVRQAVRVASHSLAEELEKSAPGADSRAADRMHSSLLRYLSRMSSRPTPYGLFAQVEAGEFGEATTLARTGEHPAAGRTRADMGWLMALVKEMEGDPELRGELTVGVNPLLQRTGDRITLAVAQTSVTADQQSSSVRATRAVDAVLARAAARPRWSELIAALAGEFPAAPPAKITALMDQLWDLGMLTSDLRPALTHPCPEQAVLDRIEGLAGAGRYRRALRRTRQLAAAADQAPPEEGSRLLAELYDHQRVVVPGHTQSPFHADARLDLRGTTLHSQVADAAAEAADVLLRLGQQTPRLHHLAVYHREFLERYGVGAEVPVLDLLNPETGLDAPETYRYPPRELPLTPSPRKDRREQEEALAALAAAALHQGKREVEITDAFLKAWQPRDDGGSGPDARPSLDIMGQVVAGSRGQLDDGDWKFVLSTGPMRDGGRFGGRFFDLLGENFQKLLQEYATAEEELCTATVFAELNYAQLEGRRGNVAVHPPVRRYEICVNASPTGGDVQQIDLSDVLVGATPDRFYLRSARLDRQLHVTQSHLVNWGSAPNVCRFLLEASEDGWAPLAEFSWGAMERAPFLPRVTRGRIVLKPARWLFGSDVPGFPDGCADAAAMDREAFFDAFGQWRQAWQVPRWVHLSLFDHRILLDLENPLCVDELQRALRTSYGPGGPGALVLEESVADPAQPSWLRDADGRSYANEIVVPLLARKTAVETPVPVVSPAAALAARELAADPARAKRQTAGGDWAHVKLYAAAARHEDILSGSLPELIRGLREEGLIDRWFFIRYGDPHPHLRIRVRRAPGADASAPLVRLVGWAKGLVDAGLAADLAVVSYDRETERYGGPLVMDAAEAVFEAGSDMATALLGLLRSRPGLDADIVGAYALDALHRQWGAAPDGGHGLAGKEIPSATRERFRTVRRTLCDLIAPWDERPDPLAREWADALGTVLAVQADVVADAGRLVRSLAESGQLIGTEREILGSLAHMQSIRLQGLDREREVRCGHLRALALRAVQGRRAAGGRR
ncbi:lantibiotic dehydratase [Streptomyces sp. NBC_00162]|uniref:lantibiotic dehydratase n=1 Tax=Streptomyces sp. NBC_00162 TaxID=2903629 RepID=UPI00214B8A3E|nr:lantibiotic dehydratase [Streptomyces sp. NBC_00162]UUU40175.1 lantibiotic dehydratase [Streptomyces sp. NBC_00162]